MKKFFLLASVARLTLQNAAHADAPVSTAAATTSSKATIADTSSKGPKTVKPTSLSCEEFLEYDDVSRPQIVYWSEGFSRKDLPHDAVFDFERTNTLVPILIEDCTRDPKTSYWKKFKAEVKKIL